MTSTITSPTATPTGESYTFGASDDARVYSGSPNYNYGGETFLRLWSSRRVDHSYAKFVVSGVSGDVQSATLRLFAFNGSNDAGSVYAVSNSWDESTVTWNNAPPLSGTPLDTLGSIGSNEWAEYDVTEAVTGNGTYSFGLANGSSDAVEFDSKEASGNNHPELVIVTSQNAMFAAERAPAAAQGACDDRWPAIVCSVLDGIASLWTPAPRHGRLIRAP